MIYIFQKKNEDSTSQEGCESSENWQIQKFVYRRGFDTHEIKTHVVHEESLQNKIRESSHKKWGFEGKKGRTRWQKRSLSFLKNPDDLFEHLDSDDIFDLKTFNKKLHAFQVLPDIPELDDLDELFLADDDETKDDDIDDDNDDDQDDDDDDN